MTMSIIKPNVLAASALASTTAVDAYAVYSSSTTYALNANVTYPRALLALHPRP